MLFLGSTIFDLRLPKLYGVLLIALGLGVLFAVYASIDPYSPASARAAFGYAQLAICLLAFYNFLIRYGFPIRTLCLVNLIWLAVGLIEIVDPTLSQLISAHRTTADRGMTSMAPEPTYFAVYLFFSSWLLLAAYRYRPSRNALLLCIANGLAILLLARSSMGVLFVGLGLAAYFGARMASAIAHRRANPRRIAMGMALLIGGLGALSLVDILASGQRVDRILDMLANRSLTDIILADASINERVEAVVLSIHGFFRNGMLPGGFDTFIYTRLELLPEWGDLFWYSAGTNKIMSWIGGTLYELGFFGAIALLVLFGASKAALWEKALLFAVLLSAIPVAFPPAAMMLGFWIFRDWYYARQAAKERLAAQHQYGYGI